MISYKKVDGRLEISKPRPAEKDIFSLEELKKKKAYFTERLAEVDEAIAEGIKLGVKEENPLP